ncbi:MAG: SRPBCC family protein [Planctomycetaceae bacterium]|nr:SRPBCC family protein [Planctomycetaceae bacterium]
MNDRSFVYVIHIGTTAAQLWEALTTGEFTQQYWGGRRIESSWEVGSPVSHIKPDGGIDWQGEIVECNPPQKLVYTFKGQGDHWEGEPSRVEFTISPSGPTTVMLRIVHDQLSEKAFQGISMGWPAILSNLKSLLEGGSTLAYHWKG